MKGSKFGFFYEKNDAQYPHERRGIQLPGIGLQNRTEISPDINYSGIMYHVWNFIWRRISFPKNIFLKIGFVCHHHDHRSMHDYIEAAKQAYQRKNLDHQHKG